MTTAWIEEAVQTKGDLPGHPFRGNQWSGGISGGLSNDAASNLISRASSSQIYEGGRENILDKQEGHLYRGYTFKDEDSTKEFLTSGKLGGQSSVYGKTVFFAEDPDYATSHIRGEGFGVLVEVKNDGKSFEQSGQFQVAKGDADFGSVTRIVVLKAQLDSSIWGAHSRAIMEVGQQKSPSRLAILRKALEIATQAVRLKERLVQRQLRTAVVREVHLKQYAETEAELGEALTELIKRQYADASKQITEKGGTGFNPRDWDDDLINTALPILMKKAGEAAAAQMLLMGLDIAPKGKRTKGDLPGHPFRGNQWSGGQVGKVQAIDAQHEKIYGLLSTSLSGYRDANGNSETILQSVRLGRTTPLSGDTGDEFYRELGHSNETIHIVRRELDGHGSVESIQKVSDIRIIELMSEDSPAGRMMRDVAATETALLKAYYDGHQERVEIEVARINKDAKFMAEIGDEYALRDAETEVGYLRDSDPPKLYRRGDIGINKVESWTTNSSGAQTQHIGGESRIVPNRERDIGEMLAEGYISIGGTGRMMGAPGESERTMINWKLDQKSPSHLATKSIQTKASRATEWLLDLDDADVATMALWPEVFTLPSGLTVDLGFATEWPDWMKAEISQQMKECFEQPFWAGINDTTANGIQSHVLKGIEEGLSIREIREQMVGDGLDEYYYNRGINIARTESGNALNGARSAAMDRLAEEVPGLRTKKTWMSVLGTTTRDSHAHLDGVPADRDGMWYLGGVRIPWPGHWNLGPSERCNCFPAETLVSGRFNGAQMARYEGTFAKIITRSGAELTLTPNHPVVTSKGLVAAGMLKPGDQVACYRAKSNTLFVDPGVGKDRSAGDQVDDKPSLIKDVFEALAAVSKVEVVGSVVGDFYGDGKSIDSDICIVRADGELLKHFEVAGSEKVGHGVPALSEQDCLAFEFGNGPPGKRFWRVRRIPPSIPSLSKKLLGDDTSVWRISPSGSLSVGVAADFDSSLLDSRTEDGPGITGFLRQALEGYPGNVTFDDVVEVRYFEASHFVYDLQSEFGTVMASDPLYTDKREILYIITSNCQCTIVESFGMGDEAASELIEEYNQRLNEERRLRDLWEKGDLPGHPFRGNQWTGGRGFDEANAVDSMKDFSQRDRIDREINKGNPPTKSSDVTQIKKYTAHDFNKTPVYERINRVLRSGGELKASDGKIVDSLDRVIDQNPSQIDAIVYRAMARRQGQPPLPDMKVGDQYVDGGYTSTSSGWVTGADFQAYGAVDHRMLQIRIPKGHPALAIDKKLKDGPSEHEVILPRQTRFKVSEIKEVDLPNRGKRQVYVIDILPYEEPGQKSIKGDLPGHPFRGNQHSGGGGLQANIAGMIFHLETIFKGPGRAAAVNEVLSAAKFPEYLKGILAETPGMDEISAVVSWSVRRGRIWEVA